MSTSSLKPAFVSKLPTTAISIFSQMSALAEKHQAINLSQGFPNYPTSDALIDRVAYYMHQGYNQYAPMPGVLSLRETLATKVKDCYGLEVSPIDEITVTAGGTEALFSAIAATVHAGDEVIIFEPAYDSYAPSIKLFGGITVPIRLYAPDFKFDWEEVRKAITVRTKLVILNNPNNPSTKVWSQEDLEALEQLLQGTSIFVLSDEVYEHIVFDGQKHHTVLSFPSLRERSFVVASFGKLLHTTGWKLGYVIAPPLLTQEFRKVHQFNVFSTNTPMQYAIADYIQDAENYRYLSSFFQAKRDYLVEGLQSTRFNVIPSEGTYFLLVDYSAISNASELDFAIQLTQEHAVATIPVSAFYSQPVEQKLLRICFAKDENTLSNAIERLKKL